MKKMTRMICALAVALAVTAVAVRAQDVKTETKTKVDDAKVTTYTGCVETGTVEKTFVLSNAIAKVETTTGAGKVTSYVLVPQGEINFQTNVGQKVEVTAMVIPAGDDKSTVKTETTTKVEGQPTQRTETKEKIEQKDWPQLRVVSVKHLADRCTPRP
jgi:hypothetical protein